MKTFWRSLLLALKITLVIVLVVSLCGIGVLSWYLYDTTFAEMDAEAKNSISHRGRAVEKLAAFFKL